jgi:hypothetical protein
MEQMAMIFERLWRHAAYPHKIIELYMDQNNKKHRNIRLTGIILFFPVLLPIKNLSHLLNYKEIKGKTV